MAVWRGENDRGIKRERKKADVMKATKWERKMENHYKKREDITLKKRKEKETMEDTGI